MMMRRVRPIQGFRRWLGRVGLWAVLTVSLGAGGLATAAGWQLSVAPPAPMVPGHLIVTVTGPGPAPTVRIKTSEVTYREPLKPDGPGRWQGVVQLVSPGTTEVAILAGGQVVQRKVIHVGESTGSVVARVLGGAVLLAAFLLTWRRTRRSLS
jgi:hypothetical protein